MLTYYRRLNNINLWFELQPALIKSRLNEANINQLSLTNQIQRFTSALVAFSLNGKFKHCSIGWSLYRSIHFSTRLHINVYDIRHGAMFSWLPCFHYTCTEMHMCRDTIEYQDGRHECEYDSFSEDGGGIKEWAAVETTALKLLCIYI